jgi:hypothetical protein
MLQRGDLLPHFAIKTLDGGVMTYSTIWQRKNLVLVILPGAALNLRSRAYVSQLNILWLELSSQQSECVFTQDSVPGLPGPGALIADRWGEIVHVAGGSDVADLPTPEDLLDWIRYVEIQCPECEGEAK